MTKTVPELLRDAADLFEKRNADYGGNYMEFGTVMDAMLPNGIQMSKPNDYRRLILFAHLVTKLTRYARSLHRGGHADSLADLAVYAMMTMETDALSTESIQDIRPAPVWNTTVSDESAKNILLARSKNMDAFLGKHTKWADFDTMFGVMKTINSIFIQHPLSEEELRVIAVYHWETITRDTITDTIAFAPAPPPEDPPEARRSDEWENNRGAEQARLSRRLARSVPRF